MDMSKLWEAWPIAGPWHLSLLAGGTNNTVYRAEAADGQCYALRLNSDNTSIPRIRYEAALLEAISNMQLPFSLPVPLKAQNDDIVVPFEQEAGKQAFAILSHFLPGSSPDRNDSSIAANAGLALAWLDQALATFPKTYFSAEDQALPSFGMFTSLHPLVPDPLNAVEQLPLNRDHAKQICHFLTTVMGNVPELYSKLPQQLLHRDYDPGNILVNEQKQITAVLDFEFAGTDLRVLDLCVAMSWWAVNLLGTGKEWEVIDAFGNAYIEHFPLDEEELRAFPSIWRLRDATSFVHRMGRYRAGLETDARMQDRVQHSLWREAWLSANQEKLVQHALRWGKEKNV